MANISRIQKENHFGRLFMAQDAARKATLVAALASQSDTAYPDNGLQPSAETVSVFATRSSPAVDSLPT